MDAVVALTGHGGWPMTVFLTPDGEPFYGGTYYPPEPRHGLPAFRQVLTARCRGVPRATRGGGPLGARSSSSTSRARATSRRSADPLTETLLRDALRNVKPQFEPRWGGFGGAPKFPPASTLEFLLRMRLRFDDDEALAMAAHTLDGMALGGMWDAVGGGFHRYSVDAQWLVPHFEKMLYDNALLASAYVHGWAVTGEERYREVAERTVEYVLRELSLPEGGFASAQDADTDGVEGLTFTWTPRSWPGCSASAATSCCSPSSTAARSSAASSTEDERTRLLAAREQRPQPGRDDKAIASWNGLMLATLAEAGRRLGRDDWLARAPRAGRVHPRAALHARRAPAPHLPARARPGTRACSTTTRTSPTGCSSSTPPTATCAGSRRRTGSRCSRSSCSRDDERGGFWLGSRDGEQLAARKKSFDDHPTPSGNSMLAYVLLRLARIYGDDELERRAAGVLRLVRDSMARIPTAFGHALCALDLYLAPPRELAIVGPRADAEELAAAALARWEPNTVVAWSPGARDDVALLAGKGMVDGRPALYVCERFACQAPVTDPVELTSRR